MVQITLADKKSISVLYLQNIKFIMYQLRRTTATTLIHLSLPLVYTLGLSLIDPQLNMVMVCTLIDYYIILYT